MKTKIKKSLKLIALSLLFWIIVFIVIVYLTPTYSLRSTSIGFLELNKKSEFLSTFIFHENFSSFEFVFKEKILNSTNYCENLTIPLKIRLTISRNKTKIFDEGISNKQMIFNSYYNTPSVTIELPSDTIENLKPDNLYQIKIGVLEPAKVLKKDVELKISETLTTPLFFRKKMNGVRH